MRGTGKGRAMDVLEELHTRLAIWQYDNISQWPLLVLLVLQQKDPMSPKSIFRIDRNAKTNAFKMTQSFDYIFFTYSFLVISKKITKARNHQKCSFHQVCREFQRGNCTRGEGDCRYAHPMEAGMVDSSENSVIVCMDYIKGRCSRDKCKYFHPPAHLQARIKAAQHQATQNTASAALVSHPVDDKCL